MRVLQSLLRDSMGNSPWKNLLSLSMHSQKVVTKTTPMSMVRSKKGQFLHLVNISLLSSTPSLKTLNLLCRWASNKWSGRARSMMTNRLKSSLTMKRTPRQIYRSIRSTQGCRLIQSTKTMLRRAIEVKGKTWAAYKSYTQVSPSKRIPMSRWLLVSPNLVWKLPASLVLP